MKQLEQAKHRTMIKIMIWKVFVVWLTDERRLDLFQGRTIVRDPYHREPPTRWSSVWICTEPEFRPSWMKLCSRDNHHAAVLLLTGNSWLKSMSNTCQNFYHKKPFTISQMLQPLDFLHFDFFYYTVQWELEMSKNQDHCHVVNGSKMGITITCKARPLIFSGFKSSVLWILWDNVTFFLLLHFDMTL